VAKQDTRDVVLRGTDNRPIKSQTRVGRGAGKSDCSVPWRHAVVGRRSSTSLDRVFQFSASSTDWTWTTGRLASSDAGGSPDRRQSLAYVVAGAAAARVDTCSSITNFSHLPSLLATAGNAPRALPV